MSSVSHRFLSAATEHLQTPFLFSIFFEARKAWLDLIAPGVRMMADPVQYVAAAKDRRLVSAK